MSLLKRKSPSYSIDRTSSGKLRLPSAAAHVETLGNAKSCMCVVMQANANRES
jgi:hypothetical protein